MKLTQNKCKIHFHLKLCWSQCNKLVQIQTSFTYNRFEKFVCFQLVGFKEINNQGFSKFY
jgi:hypothetical protein